MKKVILATYKNPFSRDAAGNIDVLINLYERIFSDDDELEETDFIGQTNYWEEDGEVATETDIRNAAIEWLRESGIEWDEIEVEQL
jgi:hypothetical protein